MSQSREGFPHVLVHDTQVVLIHRQGKFIGKFIVTSGGHFAKPLVEKAKSSLPTQTAPLYIAFEPCGPAQKRTNLGGEVARQFV